MDKQIFSTKSALETFQEGDGPPVLSGYAVKWADVYETPYLDVQFEKGAFAWDDVVVLNGHNDEAVIGSTNSGTKLEMDDTGLKFNVPLNDTSIARDVYEQVRNKDVGGVSVGIARNEYRIETNDDDDDKELLVHTSVKLIEFSITAFPSFKDTEVEAHSFGAYKEIADGKRDAETERKNKEWNGEASVRLARARMRLSGMPQTDASG